MSGSVLQDIAIVSHVNLFLQEGKIDHEFFRSNSVILSCTRVVFFQVATIPVINRKIREVFAVNPKDWFMRIQHEGCMGLSLHYLHSKNPTLDHEDAGLVGGGGHWLICAKFKQEHQYWYGEWDSAKKVSPELSGWAVSYVNYLTRKDNPFVTPSLLESKDRLGSALDRVIEFTDRNQMIRWKPGFIEAKAELDAISTDQRGYFNDMIPKGVGNPIARRLLVAAAKSDRFGGMGSWNEFDSDSVDQYPLYKEISVELYDAMCQAYSVGTNRLYEE